MENMLNDVINMFYPNACFLCKTPLIENERHICLECLFDLPKTNYHTNKSNPARDLFAGYQQVNEATAYLFFERDGKTQKMIHSLKYYGNKELAEYLGKTAASELKVYGFFASIDVIIPVPLHPKKEKKRGYNQSEYIAKGLSSVYGCEVDTKSLKRIVYTNTQTRKNIYDRHVNVENIFEATNIENLAGKYVLLVDDVMTTGATTSACIEALRAIPSIKIGIFALSIARDY